MSRCTADVHRIRPDHPFAAAYTVTPSPPVQGAGANSELPNL